MTVGSSNRQIDYERVRIEQYKSLRKEVMDLATATRRVETYIIGATAALYAYLTKNPLGDKWWVLFLPVPLILFGMWRSMRLFGLRERLFEEIHDIERQAGIESEKETGHKLTAIMLWAMLVILSVIAPFFLRSKSVVVERPETGALTNGVAS